MTGQLGPLLALRWRMVRAQRTRLGFVALATSVPMVVIAGVYLGLFAPDTYRFEASLLAPSAFLAFSILAVVAPLVAGGGNELFPDDQLVAFPVTARTQFLTTLVLAPLNLAWIAQVVGLFCLVAYVAGPNPGSSLSLATTALFIVLATVIGQSLAWLVIGLRQRRWGRRVTWSIALAFAAAMTLLLITGSLGEALDRSPTTALVSAAMGPAEGHFGAWGIWVAVMLVLLWLGIRVGARACSWALRRSADIASSRDSRNVRRRAQQPSPLWELVAVDRASVWRSVALRRGLLVLSFLPALIAAAARLDWPSLVLMPGLVSAGAGLLFGVNAFCLDASGAVWLATLPHHARHAFTAKSIVIFEVCGIAVAITMIAGAASAVRAPTGAELAALSACGAICITQVVAICMTLSVTRPHRADLLGARDTPAPPGVMAVYSVRLAMTTTLIGVLFSLLARAPDWRIPASFAVPFLLFAFWRLAGAWRRWADPAQRARIVTVVAAG